MLAQSLRPAKQRTATSIRTVSGVSRRSLLFQIQEADNEGEEKTEADELEGRKAEGGEAEYVRDKNDSTTLRRPRREFPFRMIVQLVHVCLCR